MTANYVTPQGEVSRGLPQPALDLTPGTPRLGRYREALVAPLWQSQHGLADEGSYFAATNPTPGTAIAFVVSAAVSETAGYFLVIRNTDGVNGAAKRIYMDQLRLVCGVVPASGVSGHYFWKLGPLPNHYTSGGSQLVPQNVNGDGSNASIAWLSAGANVTVADSAARLVDRGVLRSAIPVANDEWIFKFGGSEAAAPSSLGGTVALRMPIPVPPVVIPPQWHLSLQLWFPSNAATPSQFELAANWWER